MAKDDQRNNSPDMTDVLAFVSSHALCQEVLPGFVRAPAFLLVASPPLVLTPAFAYNSSPHLTGNDPL